MPRATSRHRSRDATVEAPSEPADAEQVWATAVHDLKDPLHTASSFLDLLASRSSLDADGRHCLEQAQGAIQDCLSLVQATLDWTRAGGAGTDPARTASASDALAAARRLLGDLLEGTTLDAEALPDLRADPDGLRRVFQNLLANAARHGGPHVRVRARREGRGAWVDVEDDGPGIPAGLDPFAPFARGGTEGTGLGLAYVHRYVTGLGGRVEAAKSALGGARVSFWLPRSSRPPRHDAPNAPRKQD